MYCEALERKIHTFVGAMRLRWQINLAHQRSGALAVVEARTAEVDEGVRRNVRQHDFVQRRGSRHNVCKACRHNV